MAKTTQQPEHVQFALEGVTRGYWRAAVVKSEELLASVERFAKTT